MNELPAELRARVADGRHGLQRAEALALGLSDTQLARWCVDGHLESLGFGAYVVRAADAETDPFARQRTEHLRRADAILDGLPVPTSSDAPRHGRGAPRYSIRRRSSRSAAVLGCAVRGGHSRHTRRGAEARVR